MKAVEKEEHCIWRDTVGNISRIKCQSLCTTNSNSPVWILTLQTGFRKQRTSQKLKKNTRKPLSVERLRRWWWRVYSSFLLASSVFFRCFSTLFLNMQTLLWHPYSNWNLINEQFSNVCSSLFISFSRLSSLGRIFGSPIKCSEEGFVGPSSTKGQLYWHQSDICQNKDFKIPIPSLALCLTVAGCISPFSGIFLILTIRSRCFSFSIVAAIKLQGDRATPALVPAPPSLQIGCHPHLLLHLSLQHALQVQLILHDPSATITLNSLMTHKQPTSLYCLLFKGEQLIYLWTLILCCHFAYASKTY